MTTTTKILQAAEQWLEHHGRHPVAAGQMCGIDTLSWDVAWDTADAIAAIDNGDARVPWVAPTGEQALRYWTAERAKLWASLLEVLAPTAADGD
jgi:hypothetical protein